MSDYSADLHEAYIKISTWYQDPNFIYSMNEDELLGAYDYTYAVLHRFIENPLPDKNLSEEALAERNAIEEMAPVVADRINYGLAYCLFEPADKDDEDNISKMERPDKQFFKNASFVLAGIAFLLMIAAHFCNSPYGALPIKGFRYVAGWAIPLLCLWVGMLLRFKVRKPKWWILTIAAVAMVVCYFFSFRARMIPDWLSIRYQWWGLILLGFLLPWDYMFEHRDKDGIKSFVLLLISALAYSTLDFIYDRMTIVALPAPTEDLGALIGSVTGYMLPFVTLLPLYFATEFSFSKAGQWIGSQKWVRWIVGIVSVVFFVSFLVDCTRLHRPFFMWHLTQLLMQPFTIFLIVIICRILRKLQNKEITWKEVFDI